MPKLYYRKSDPADLRELDLAAFGDNPKRLQWVEAPKKPSADAVWNAGAWTLPEPPSFTAESWLDHQGYGAMRLLGLLDLEAQFGQQAPPKMQAVRAWINSIRAQYAETKSDWQPAPHTFEETMQEIAQWQTN
jgi:hypothetical protein